MPNWSTNRVTISGEENVRKFKEIAMPDGLFRLEHIVPQPPKVKLNYHLWKTPETPVKQLKPKLNDTDFLAFGVNGRLDSATNDYMNYSGFCLDVCDWCIEHWGTKWEVDDIGIVASSKDYLQITFDTAWAPPVEAFISLSKKGVEFLLEYAIEGGLGSGAIEGKLDDDGTVGIYSEQIPDGEGYMYLDLCGYDPWEPDEED